MSVNTDKEVMIMTSGDFGDKLDNFKSELYETKTNTFHIIDTLGLGNMGEPCEIMVDGKRHRIEVGMIILFAENNKPAISKRKCFFEDHCIPITNQANIPMPPCEIQLDYGGESYTLTEEDKLDLPIVSRVQEKTVAVYAIDAPVEIHKNKQIEYGEAGQYLVVSNYYNYYICDEEHLTEYYKRLGETISPQTVISSDIDN